MNVASLTLKNWMNFRDLTDVPLHTRTGCRDGRTALEGQFQALERERGMATGKAVLGRHTSLDWPAMVTDGR